MATASELWERVFGKGVQAATDYTGRPMKKAAYNQSGSAYDYQTKNIVWLKLSIIKGLKISREISVSA